MIAMTSHPWQPGWNVAALVRRPKIVWRETSAPSITAKFPWIFSQYCLEYLVGSKYYRKVSLSLFQILPWISCLLHAMQFVSVNIVILKKVGLVSMDKHLWKWWSQSGQSIFVKTMIFSKMTVSEALTIIMTNINTMTLTRTTRYSLFRAPQLQEKAEQDNARLRPTVLQGWERRHIVWRENTTNNFIWRCPTAASLASAMEEGNQANQLRQLNLLMSHFHVFCF